MIVPGQRNLKVHFAGVESFELFVPVAAAGVKYMLASAFKSLAPKFNIKTFGNGKGDKPVGESIVVVDPEFHHLTYDQLLYAKIEGASRHHILDSGLFSLMWGAAKNTDTTILEGWLDKYVEHILTSAYKGTCVEVDCQKVLSPEVAWVYRKRMRDAIPNRMINVFHIEDGPKGLDRLIEYSDYIAVSVPELRFNGKTEYCLRLVHYIKNRKPEIDIHLLGCTQADLVRSLRFCTSSDSTAWTSGFRWGALVTRNGDKTHIKGLDQSKLSQPYQERMVAAFNFHGLKLTADPEVASRRLFSAHETLLYYSQLIGDQF